MDAPKELIELPGYLIAEEIRHTAEAAVSVAARDLGIARPTVRWFSGFYPAHLTALAPNLSPSARKATDIGQTGLTYPEHLNEIWIRTGIGRRETALTAAHECRHIWQFGRGWNVTESFRKDMEPDAQRYHETFFERMIGVPA